MSTDIKTQLEHSVQATVDLVETLAAMIDAGGTIGDLVEYGAEDVHLQTLDDHGYDLETQDYVHTFQIMDDAVLEMYGKAKVRPGHDPEITSIVLVTGVGGPHVEVELFDHSVHTQYEARGYWGTDKVSLRGTIDRDLYGLLEEVLGIYEG